MVFSILKQKKICIFNFACFESFVSIVACCQKKSFLLSLTPFLACYHSRSPSNLYCVGADIKPCSINQNHSCSLCLC